MFVHLLNAFTWYKYHNYGSIFNPTGKEKWCAFLNESLRLRLARDSTGKHSYALLCQIHTSVIRCHEIVLEKDMYK